MYDKLCTCTHKCTCTYTITQVHVHINVVVHTQLHKYMYKLQNLYKHVVSQNCYSLKIIHVHLDLKVQCTCM